MQCLESVFFNDKEIIKIGFMKSGIVPWNHEVLDFSMLLPSMKYKLDYKECVLWQKGEKIDAQHEEEEQTKFAQKERQEIGVNDDYVQVEM